MLGSIIYLGPDIVIIAGLSSHKSKIIYYFKIAHYQKKLTFNRGVIEKLDVYILRVGSTASSQPSFYCFTYSSANRITSVSFFFILIYWTQKGVRK